MVEHVRPKTRDLSPPKHLIYLRYLFRFGFAVSSQLTCSRRPHIKFLFVTWRVLARRWLKTIGYKHGSESVSSSTQDVSASTIQLYEHLRRLPPHGRSPFRSCLRLVLFFTSYPFGIMTPIKKTGTKYRGLSPHKITPIVGRTARETSAQSDLKSESTPRSP